MKKDLMWGYLIRLGSGIYDVFNTGNWERDIKHDKFATELTKLRTDDKTWKKVTDFLPSQGINTLVIDIGEGMQYESHPELAVEGSWSKDKLKTELARLRSIGLTPIPKLNFSKCHDLWLKNYRNMIALPEYYKVCEDTIREVVEVFGTPELIHLGMDDELTSYQDGLKLEIQRNEELWWKDLYFMFNLCDKLGVRPWVNADAYWRLKEEYVEKMPKSVMQSNWFYHYFDPVLKPEQRTPYEQAYEELDKAGFEQIATCSSNWCADNAAGTTENLKKRLSQRLCGYLTNPVIETDADSLYTHLDEAYRLYYAKKWAYPELCK